MPFLSRCFALVGISLAAACNGDADSLTAPPQESSALRSDGRPELTVMTRNLYIGADVDAVIGALASPDPSDDVPSLMEAITTLQETDYSTRVKAFAEEIAQHRPHVIGLQEVSDIDIDLAALGLPIVISLDFLPALQSELSARGLNYVVAAQVTNIQATPLPGISLVDFDAILVDVGRATPGEIRIEQNFSTNIGVVAPGVTIKRGFVAVDVTIDGQTYLVANTHLESGSAPGLDQLRAGQVIELIAVLASAPRAVLLGDLNDVPGSPMHRMLSEAGFTDVWSTLQPRKAGYTCCHLADLSNNDNAFTQRIDYVLTRGFGRRGSLSGEIERIGENRNDRVSGPFHDIWPSDHAGLVATLFSRIAD